MYFHRTESDTQRATSTECNVTSKDALAEVNHAMMDGKKDVHTMSAGSGNYAIAYKDGRIVILVRMKGNLPEPTPAVDDEHWSTASHRFLLHKFDTPDESGRATCNRRFRASLYGGVPHFRTRAQIESDEHGHMYTFCERCASR